jgi:hypothetical protein
MDANPLDANRIDDENHQLEQPFDVANVPPHMDASPDDAYPQRLVNNAVMRSVHADADNLDLHDFENSFLDKPLTDISLSTLRHLYVNHLSVCAIRLLQERRHLIVNDEFLLHLHNERVVPSVHGHYVDYILCLGARHGLDAETTNYSLRVLMFK